MYVMEYLFTKDNSFDNKPTSTFFYDDHGNSTRIVHDKKLEYFSSRRFGYDKMTSIREYVYKEGRPVSATSTNTVQKDGEENVYVSKWECVYY